MSACSRQLVLHGMIVLLFGMLLGEPYERAIRRDAPPQVINAWRLAHFSLPIGATAMLAIAALLSSMRVGTGLQWLIAIGLIVSSYAFSVSAPLAAIIGERGPGSGGVGIGRLVHAGHVVGAVGSIVAGGALAYSVAVSL